MLGIVVSLSRELKSLTRQTIPVGTWRAISDDTLVALSGIGAERAHKAGSVLVSQGATALLSWGFAAALDDRLHAGCLILPERIIGANGEIHPVAPRGIDVCIKHCHPNIPFAQRLWLKVMPL